MKKIISISCLLILMLSSKAYSQSNITWTLNDKIEKGYLKSHTTFNTNISGFTTKEEAAKFLKKLNANQEVLSAETSNTDAIGNTDIKLIMKQTHDKMYYVSLAQKLGVTYLQMNGIKKTPAQLFEEKRNKQK